MPLSSGTTTSPSMMRLLAGTSIRISAIDLKRPVQLRPLLVSRDAFPSLRLGLDAIAIVSYLVEPAFAGRHYGFERGIARLNETGKWR